MPVVVERYRMGFEDLSTIRQEISDFHFLCERVVECMFRCKRNRRNLKVFKRRFQVMFMKFFIVKATFLFAARELRFQFLCFLSVYDVTTIPWKSC